MNPWDLKTWNPVEQEKYIRLHGIARGLARARDAVNPWTVDAWNITAQQKFTGQFGQDAAGVRAKEAGTTLDGLPPPGPPGQYMTGSYIFKRRLEDS